MLPEHLLHIVHVVRQFYPGVGGMENFVEQLALKQVEEGHRVRVITLNRLFDAPDGRRLAEHETHHDIEVVRLAFSGSRRYPIVPGILGAVRGADIVHVHGVDFFCDFLAATRWIHRRPLVLTTHGGFFHTPFATRLKRLYFTTITRLSLGAFSAVVACSEEDERRFRRIAPSRVLLIRNPVDIAKFAGLAKPTSQRMIYFGRLAVNKELATLVDWFAALRSAGHDWQLVIAGAPMGVEPKALKAQATALGVSAQVQILAGPSDEGLRDVIAGCSVYVCASSYEGFGLAAIEAASAGLLPVLNHIPPFRQTVDTLGFGLTVDFPNRAKWPASFASLASSLATFREDFSPTDIADAVRPFSWSGAIHAFNSVYDQVLGRLRRRLGKVHVDVVDSTTAKAVILAKASVREPLMVAFCNAHTVNLAERDERLRDALRDALVLNDGIGVDLASRAIYGRKFPENLNGTDFVPFLLSSGADPLRVFLLGAAPGVAEVAAAKLSARNERIQVAGTADGYFTDAQSEAVVAQIRASRPDIVLVALGQPRQEIWVAQNVQAIGVPTICVGALFDFLAERVVRAPALVRRLRMEWVFRLIQEPRRLAQRYLIGNVVFVSRVIKQRWRNDAVQENGTVPQRNQIEGQSLPRC